MDLFTILAIGLALLLVVGRIVFELSLDRLMNPVLGWFGLHSSTGPLVCHRTRNAASLGVSILNRGRTKAGIAAMSIASDQGETRYPIPFATEDEAADGAPERSHEELRRRLVSYKIDPGESRTVHLSLQELAGCDLDSLRVMDTHGKSWPVSSNG